MGVFVAVDLEWKRVMGAFDAARSNDSVLMTFEAE